MSVLIDVLAQTAPHSATPRPQAKKRLGATPIYGSIPRSDGLCLDANEMRFPLPDEFLARVAREISTIDFRRYPDAMEIDALEAAIAANIGVRAKNILLGVGSTEMLDLVCRAFGGPFEAVVVPTPTFPLYGHFAALNDKGFVTVPLDDAFVLSTEVVDKMTAVDGAKIFYVGNPNNPTGRALDRGVFERLAASTSDLLCLDEAYSAYADVSYATDAIDRHNVIVAQSFSKIGLAGCRLGYLVASEPLIGELERASLPYRVNAMTACVARIFLEEAALFQPLIDQVKRERERLREELARMPGFSPFRSEGNFLFCATPRTGASVAEELRERFRVFVKAFPPTSRIGKHLRITVGTPSENDALLEALASLSPVESRESLST